MVKQRSVTIKRIAGTRARQVCFGRFLSNKKVTPELLIQQAAVQTAAAVAGKHVLLIEDSSELSFGLLPRATGLGTVGNGKEHGFYIHPVLAVDADERACYGLAAARIYLRPELPEHLKNADLKARKRYWDSLPFDQKTSSRWLDTPLQAMQNCPDATRMTVVADRESDVYEALDGFGKAGLDFVVRASKNRPLDGPAQIRRKQQQQASARKIKAAASGANPPAQAQAAVPAQPDDALIATVYEKLATLPVAGTYTLKLPATEKRSAHTASLDVKYTAVRIRRPKTATCRACSEALDVYVVEVRERASSVVGAEQPILWTLVTSHPVETMEQALQVIEWYKWRWDIEQTFRLLKSKGMDMESSGIQTYERLAKMAVMALVAAIRVLQLVLARDNNTHQSLTTGFSDEQITFMQLLNRSLEGNTAKQRNPHPPGTLAYGSWVIARLGSWMGYGKTPPGPMTMHRGLVKFYEQFEGYCLAAGVT